MSDDFYSFYGANQQADDTKSEPEAKKSSGVQTRKLAVTNAPSASVPTPSVPAGPLAQPDPRQIDQPALAAKAQEGLAQAGPPKAPSAIDAMSETGKDLLPYLLTGGGTLVAAKLWDMFKGKGGGDGGGPPSGPSGPSHQDLINEQKLERERLKTEKAKIEHENWVAQNTLSDAEKMFGRKAKDKVELQLMEKAYEQRMPPVSGATAPPPSVAPAPVAPVTPPASATAPSAVAPVSAPATPELPKPTVQSANVISTGLTPEAAAAPIEKAEKVKEVTQPTKAKTEPKIPKPEFFKNAPAAERYMYGTFTKYMDQPASAQAVVARAADYLPEGSQWQMKSPTEGGGLHPEQQSHFNRFASEQLGIPLKEGKLPEDFKWTTENRNKLASSVQSELEQHAKAGTLGKLGKGALAAAALLGISEAVQAAQKGDFGPLREAGFDIGLSAIPHPAVQAIVTGLTGTTLQPGTLPTTPTQSFERNVLGRKGVKEELAKLTAGKTGAEFNAIRDQYLYSNPRAISDYDRYVQHLQKQARQPIVPR